MSFVNVVYRKFDFYILISMTSKSRSNWESVSWCIHVRGTCSAHFATVTNLQRQCISSFYDDLNRGTLVQGDLFLSSDQGWLVSLCMQNYKCLCAAATICATLVNKQTHRPAFDQLILTVQPAELKWPFGLELHSGQS